MFLSIVFTNILSKIIPPFTAFTSIPITLIFFFCELLLYNLRVIPLARRNFSKLIFTTFIDFTLFGRIVFLYRENKKNFDRERTFADMERSFQMVFIRGFQFTVAVYFVYALLSTFLYFESGEIKIGIYTYIPGTNLTPTLLSQLSSYIIIHNLIVFVEIIAGAIPFFIISFGSIFYSGGIVVSMIVGSLLNGTANLILPSGILELLAIALASGVGMSVFSLIYYFFTGTYTSENELRKYYSVNIPKVIIGIGVTLFLFLIVWDIEYYILLVASGSSPYPANWYYLLYVLDFLFSASAITILFKVYKYGIIAH